MGVPSNPFGCLELNYFFRYEGKLVCQRTDLASVMQPVRKVRPGHDGELAGQKTFKVFLEQIFFVKSGIQC